MKRQIFYTLMTVVALTVSGQTTNVHLRDGKTVKVNSQYVKTTHFDLTEDTPQVVFEYFSGETLHYTNTELEYIDFYTKSQVIVQERNALMDLYNSTNGDNWEHKDNWGSNKPLSEWYGVRTDSDGRVLSISLSNNNLSGLLPESLGDLDRLEYLYLNSNNLTGTLPYSFRNLVHLEVLSLHDNSLTGNLSIIGELTELCELNLGGNSFSDVIPESITNLTKLYLLVLSGNHLTGEIPENIGELKELIVLMLQDNDLSGNMPESIVKISNLSSLWLSGNRLNGKIPDVILNSDWWNQLSEIYIEQQDGYGLYYDYYVSTDFSQDGKVVQLQKHSKGTGIPIVILGDGFSDRLIADGSFDSRAREVSDALFAQEPFTSLREFFDVYSVCAVSEYEDADQNTIFQVSSRLKIPESGINKIKEYTLKVPEIKGSLQDVTVFLIPSSKPPLIGGGLSYYTIRFSEGWSLALTPIQSVTKDINTYLVQHEGGGHGFALLDDEHVNDDATALYPDELHKNLDRDHQNGYNLNVDYHNSKETVLWKEFIDNSDYEIEQIGLYEGAMYTYAKGIYRPTYQSIMNIYGSFYNAPSRWAIYQRTMKLAGEECRFENFLNLDKRALEKIKESKIHTRAADNSRKLETKKFCSGIIRN